MDDKLYKECPKSYRLLCSKDDEEGIKAALDQLRVDHPEVFLLDDIYEPYCNIIPNKFGFIVLKKTGASYTLADDLNAKKEVFPDYYPDVVLKISPTRVFVYEKKAPIGLSEIKGAKRRFIIDRMKSSDPKFSERIHSRQSKFYDKRRSEIRVCEDMLLNAVESDRELQDFLKRQGLDE